ncbi:MAG TPA: nucleotidyl transferase AbiEii/AbiGii toxin family protein [Polyangiaceae bacterium]|nr:nucleotidyl transferase AbiEii/AbiGii toxin family protein [Polyangiaceae bacterium]
MSAKVIDPDKQRVLELQLDLVRERQFFLAGGTAIALRIGHRTSRDLDWFTPQPFDAKELAQRLVTLSEKPTQIQGKGLHTLRAYYAQKSSPDPLETSFLRYTQVAAKPEWVAVGTLKVPIADMNTLVAMKAAAVHDRGLRRDFIDIHAISRRPGWSVGAFIDVAASQLPLQPAQMKLALTYFDDAEKDVVRFDYAIPWDKVKSDLQRGVRDWERNRSRGLDR